MAFIGNTNTTQAFTPAVDYFSGNGSTTAFTLSRPVASVAQVQAVVNNVAQNPSSAYTVSGNTITFTSAPSSGTNNIYVYYTSPITQVIAPSQGTVGTTQLQNGLTVNFADGTAAAPSITNDGDTNTGVFYPAADTVGVSTGGSERVRVDSSGNVGIGTSSPSYKLDVRSTFAVLDGSSNIGFYANGSAYTQIWQTLQSTNDFIIQTTASKYISFGINSAEKVRIDTSGYLLINQTSNVTSSYLQIKGAQPAISCESTSTGSVSQVLFRNPNGQVGSISTSGSSTSYNTSSDYRLKQDIVPMTGALATVAQLKPVTYKWKVDGSGGQGFIAHELQEVVPDCVVGEKDAVDVEGKPVYQGVDTSFLVATLTAAIQEQQALITALTARIEALENK